MEVLLQRYVALLLACLFIHLQENDSLLRYCFLLSVTVCLHLTLAAREWVEREGLITYSRLPQVFFCWVEACIKSSEKKSKYCQDNPGLAVAFNFPWRL